MSYTKGMEEKATFAAGCFWGVEEAFRKLPGVSSTTVGYTGGTKTNPTYAEVCGGETGHKEAIEIVFNPEKTTYETLLKTFWSIHDPTTPNRQGADVGEQYSSVIFYHSEEQKQSAEESKKELQALGIYQNPIVTSIEKASTFYPAEEYHQRYLQKKNG